LCKILSKYWKFSSLYTINTQARSGYEGDKLVTAFMAPCYTNLSLGFDYNPAKSLSIYITPANIHSTYVLNDTISARGDFGVTPGKKALVKFGPSIYITYKDEILKNILLDNQSRVFSKRIGWTGRSCGQLGCCHYNEGQ
jgi:hypothetical protein